jgi:hypothetical protein
MRLIERVRVALRDWLDKPTAEESARSLERRRRQALSLFASLQPVNLSSSRVLERMRSVGLTPADLLANGLTLKGRPEDARPYPRGSADPDSCASPSPGLQVP